MDFPAEHPSGGLQITWRRTILQANEGLISNIGSIAAALELRAVGPAGALECWTCGQAKAGTRRSGSPP
jgi:hypothetical protein